MKKNSSKSKTVFKAWQFNHRYDNPTFPDCVPKFDSGAVRQKPAAE
jgi:hypothetical protein